MLRQAYTFYDLIIFLLYFIPATLHAAYFWGSVAGRMGDGIYEFRHRRRNDDSPEVPAADDLPL